MSNKTRVISFILLVIVLVGSYFVTIALKDDAQEIEKTLDSVGVINGNIIHIEHLNNKNAIAFYTSAFDPSRFGHALVKKGIFGWKLIRSSSTVGNPPDMKLGWSFENLAHEKGIEYKSFLYGKVMGGEITEVKVILEDDREYLAEMIHYGGGEESFWFLLSEGKDLDTATTIGISATGEVIFEYPER